jgi:hypothetical protein
VAGLGLRVQADLVDVNVRIYNATIIYFCHAKKVDKKIVEKNSFFAYDTTGADAGAHGRTRETFFPAGANKIGARQTR